MLNGLHLRDLLALLDRVLAEPSCCRDQVRRLAWIRFLNSLSTRSTALVQRLLRGYRRYLQFDDFGCPIKLNNINHNDRPLWKLRSGLSAFEIKASGFAWRKNFQLLDTLSIFWPIVLWDIEFNLVGGIRGVRADPNFTKSAWSVSTI